MRIIIAGGRDYKDYLNLRKVCDDIIEADGIEDPEIVSGTAKGADKMGEFYADQKGYRIKRFPADWNRYNKRAGIIRNKQMAEYSDVLIAFWDGESRGTKNMIGVATENQLTIHVIKI